MSTQIRKGIEIFSTGMWNKGTFTTADLDAMVESFDALDLSGRTPLKLGHEGPDGRLVVGARNKDGSLKDPMSQLSMGWVNKIYRKGSKLYADIEVSDKVAKLIDDKHLKFVSVELLDEVRASRRVFPWVLDAVALLGTDNPAVGILSDIQTLAMTARTPLEHSRHLMFARDDGTQSITIGEKPRMAKETEDGEVTLQTLSAQMLKFQQTIADQNNVIAGLKQENVKGQQAEQRLADLVASTAADKLKSHRAMVYKTLTDAVRDESILPAAELRFKKSYRTEDDAAVLEVSEADVREFISENPNPKKATATKKHFAAKTAHDNIPSDIPADHAVVALTFAALREDGVTKPTDEDIERAAIRVLSTNPEANKRYKKFTADAHGLE